MKIIDSFKLISHTHYTHPTFNEFQTGKSAGFETRRIGIEKPSRWWIDKAPMRNIFMS